MNPVELIIKNGLSTYKAKYSKVKNINQLKDANKSNGAIFVVREKAHFTSNGVIGYVITSLETLAEDYNGLTHWTPNTYIKYGYKDATKRYIQGFEETCAVDSRCPQGRKGVCPACRGVMDIA